LKIIILLIAIAFAPTLQQQTGAGEDPDLKVVKFSWAKDVQKTRLIRGAQNPGGPITTPIPSGASDLESRKTDMHVMEAKAAVSAETVGPSYQVRLELKNTGPKAVKGLVWKFQPTGGPEDHEPRQYLCLLEVKSKEKKVLEIWTPFAPVKVVTVDARQDALKDGEVIINKIEYADGSVWKKTGWNYRLPPDSLKKLSEGTCSTF